MMPFKRKHALSRKLLTHGASIVVVACLFGAVIHSVESSRTASRDRESGVRQFLDLGNVDYGDPVDRALVRECLGVFYPGRGGVSDSLMRAIDDLRQREFSDPTYKSGNQLQGLTMAKISGIGTMYAQFLAVYVVVFVVLYFAAQRIGVYRFVKAKQHRESYLSEFFTTAGRAGDPGRAHREGNEWRRSMALLLKAVAKGILLVLLFSPAYVIAYAMKTTLDTSSLIFMAALGIVSNGVLIQTANRFFTLLVAESHKGYVQTAMVKGLQGSYEWNQPDGIPRRSLIRLQKGLDNHVFRHILMNARFHFIPVLKEHASFLVTGLIIIEMALNIQGHLCYDLLQQILYHQYDVALFIVFVIFLTVKGTEIVVDIWQARENKRYGY